MENQKLTPEEIASFIGVRQKNNIIVAEFGNLHIAKLQLDDREIELLNFFNNLKEEEIKLNTSLFEKYGVGSIDIESGEFIPSPIVE